ncbi:hypothetical protein HK102_009329 [Quaeritorhiza haematococci]|nr:hypothetical protein HK102_009329 [Quaeritorhiza haematococci]
MDVPERLESYLARHVQDLCTQTGSASASAPDASRNLDADGLPFFLTSHNAAVAIVDIAGARHSNLQDIPLSTALSETLGDTGAGADKLRAIINPYFDRLVSTAVKYGGDTFKFAVHVGVPGVRRECFLMGEAIKDAARCIDIAGKGQIALPEKAWSAFKSHISFDHVSPFVEINDVVIIDFESVPSSKIAEWNGSTNDSTNPLPSPTTTLFTFPPPRLLLPHFKEYINEATVHRFEHEQQSTLNMLRKLTVVFVRIANFPICDPDEGTKLSQKIMEIVIPPLVQFEGTMRQFNVDEKGATVLLVWGLPPYAHELESGFALQAALMIRDTLQVEFGAGFSIGVTTGTAFTGSIGNELRSDHSILGTTVNEAARLMCHDLAQNGVLCDSTTHQECKSTFRFQPIQNRITIKGRDDAISVYIPIAPRKRTRRITNESSLRSYSNRYLFGRLATFSTGNRRMYNRLIGRDREMKLLRAMISGWKGAKGGATGTGTVTPATRNKLIVFAEAGQGKSALAHFFLENVMTMGKAIVCSGRNTEVERHTPYHALREILRTFITAVDEFEAHTQRLNRLRTASGSYYPSSLESLSMKRHFSSDSLNERPSSPSPLTTTQRSSNLSKSLHNLGEGLAMASRSASIMADSKSSDDLPIVGNRLKGSIKALSGASLSTPTSPATATPAGGHCMSIDDLAAEPKDFQEKVKRVLVKLGESVSVLPLFNEILSVQFGEDEVENGTEGEAVKSNAENGGEPSTLSDVIVRMINKVIAQYKVDVAFNVENVQWQTASGWEMLWEICRGCPTLAVLLTSRPLTEYDPTTKPHINTLLVSNLFQSTTLSPLSPDGIHEMLLEVFSKHCIERVDPRIVTEVFNRTGGNSFVVEIVCEALLRQYERAGAASPVKPTTTPGLVGHGQVDGVQGVQNEAESVVKVPGPIDQQIPRGLYPNQLVNLNGSLSCLHASVLRDLVGMALPRDSYSAIVTQYDRLGSRYQRFLAIASCLGQQFTLKTLWAVCLRDEESSSILGELSPDMLRSFIRAEDKFNFLNLGQIYPRDDVAVGQKNTLSFRHILVQKGIYSTLLSEEKERLHLATADHLIEDILNTNNIGQVVPLIIHHLEQVPNQQPRCLSFYFDMFEFYCAANSAFEGLRIYEKVVGLLDEGTVPELAKLFKRDSVESSIWQRAWNGTLFRAEGENQQDAVPISPSEETRSEQEVVERRQKRYRLEKGAAQLYLCLQEFEKAEQHAISAAVFLGHPLDLDTSTTTIAHIVKEGLVQLNMFKAIKSSGWHAFEKSLETPPTNEEDLLRQLEILQLICDCRSVRKTDLGSLYLHSLHLKTAASLVSRHPKILLSNLMAMSGKLSDLGFDAMAAEYFELASTLKDEFMGDAEGGGAKTRKGSRGKAVRRESAIVKSAVLESEEIVGDALSEEDERLHFEATMACFAARKFSSVEKYSRPLRLSCAMKKTETSFIYIQSEAVSCLSAMVAGQFNVHKAIAKRHYELAQEQLTVSSPSAFGCAQVLQSLINTNNLNEAGQWAKVCSGHLLELYPSDSATNDDFDDAGDMFKLAEGVRESIHDLDATGGAFLSTM